MAFRMAMATVVIALVAGACGAGSGSVRAEAQREVEGGEPAAEQPPTNTAAGAGDLEVFEGLGVDNLSDGMLHLPDAPAGARIGDDSRCQDSGIAGDGGGEELIELAGDARALGSAVAFCFNQLEGPDRVIHSLVVRFPSTRLARRGFEIAVLGDILGYVGLGPASGPPMAEPEPLSSPGQDALRVAAVDESTVIIIWRDRNLIGAVEVQGGPDAGGDAVRLANMQRGRMVDPLPLRADIDDDLLVPLETADWEQRWLGLRFAPSGWPPMTLDYTHGGAGDGDGDSIQLDYSLARLDIVRSGGVLEPFGTVAQQLFGSCTVTEIVDLEGGQVALFGRHLTEDELGFGSTGIGGDELPSWTQPTEDEDCPAGEPNVWTAVAVFDDASMVLINPPGCYFCIPEPTTLRPYGGPEGLAVIANSLRPYPELPG